MYRLDCTCGGHTAVSPSQAGGTVTCPQCGVLIEVPTLGELRKLPILEESAVTQKSSWSSTRGIAFGALVLAAIVFAIPAMYCGAQWWRTPPGENAEGIIEDVHEATLSMNASELLNLWGLYEEAGLDPRTPPLDLQFYEARRRYALLGSAFGLVSLIAALSAIAVARTA